MKILLVDDEELALIRLERLLNEAGYSDIVTLNNPYEALKLLKEDRSIKVAFLDIKMPHLNGLEFAYNILSEREDLFIVFQTAYEEYALSAFKAGAIDYLLKPYDIEDVQRVMKRIEKFQQREKNKVKFLARLPTGEYKLIKVEDIFYVKAELKESLLRVRDSYLYYPLSISKIEEKLKNSDFFRVHRSYLINLTKVSSIERTHHSKLIFKFKDISEVIVSSKEGAKQFREQFKNLSSKIPFLFKG